MESEKISILAVPPSELIAEWPTIGPMLETAMPVALQRYLAVDILALCITGTAQGWLVRESNKVIAVMITVVMTFPRRRGLSIFALAGERMSDWFENATDVISEYARQLKVDHLEVQGRHGWSRVFGLEPRCVLLVKDFNGGAMV